MVSSADYVRAASGRHRDQSPNRQLDLGATQLSRRKFIDPSGESNREPRQIIARRPGHMVHIDMKKVGRIPEGGGWRVNGRNGPGGLSSRPD